MFEGERTISGRTQWRYRLPFDTLTRASLHCLGFTWENGSVTEASHCHINVVQRILQIETDNIRQIHDYDTASHMYQETVSISGTCTDEQSHNGSSDVDTFSSDVRGDGYGGDPRGEANDECG